MFNYYLGWLTNRSITHHFQPVPDSTVPYAKNWGLKVAVEDLHGVIAAAQKLGGSVVLGGHSLGGSVVTGYATWNFSGKPGADDLAGLVYDDGASFGSAPERADGEPALQQFMSPSTSPWLPFVAGIPPYDSGLFGTTGGLSSIVAPNQPLANGELQLLPASLKAPVPVTNMASSATHERRHLEAVFAAWPTTERGSPRIRCERTARLEQLRRDHPDQALRADALRLPADRTWTGPSGTSHSG